MKEIDNWIIREGKDERLEIGKKQLRKRWGKEKLCLWPGGMFERDERKGERERNEMMKR